MHVTLTKEMPDFGWKDWVFLGARGLDFPLK